MLSEVLIVPNLNPELEVPFVEGGVGPGCNGAGGAAGLASGTQHDRHVSFLSLKKHLLCICKKRKENAEFFKESGRIQRNSF